MLMINKLTKSNMGFTMIELLAVVTIMAILFTVGIVSYTNASRNARNSRRQTDLANVRQALVLYRSDNGCYPASPSWQMLGNVLIADGYWSESTFPSDPSYDYIANGNCGSGMASGFDITTTLENPPGGTITMNEP